MEKKNVVLAIVIMAALSMHTACNENTSKRVKKPKVVSSSMESKVQAVVLSKADLDLARNQLEKAESNLKKERIYNDKMLAELDTANFELAVIAFEFHLVTSNETLTDLEKKVLDCMKNVSSKVKSYNTRVRALPKGKLSELSLNTELYKNSTSQIDIKQKQQDGYDATLLSVEKLELSINQTLQDIERLEVENNEIHSISGIDTMSDELSKVYLLNRFYNKKFVVMTSLSEIMKSNIDALNEPDVNKKDFGIRNKTAYEGLIASAKKIESELSQITADINIAQKEFDEKNLINAIGTLEQEEFKKKIDELEMKREVNFSTLGSLAALRKIIFINIKYSN